MGHFGSLANYGSFWIIPCFSTTVATIFQKSRHFNMSIKKKEACFYQK